MRFGFEGVGPDGEDDEGPGSRPPERTAAVGTLRAYRIERSDGGAALVGETADGAEVFRAVLGGEGEAFPVREQVLAGSPRIEDICNGYALYGMTADGEVVFLAHLGDGADGLPDVSDPNLPLAYDFDVIQTSVRPL